MRHSLRGFTGTATALFAIGAALATPAFADHGSGSGGNSPGDKQPIYDFSDSYYRANGIDPAGLVGRRNGADGLSVPAAAPDADHRGVRVTFTLPAYDTSGGHHYFTVLEDLAPTAFSPGAAGVEAKRIADANIVYVFPTRTGDQTAVSNNRQADMVDLSGGYFSHDPLGLWKHVFVSWTAKIDTPAGKARLSDLTRKNGVALDGTPIITSKSDIDSLVRDGYVSLLERGANTTGRYFVCPVFKDATHGAISKDAFLATVRRPDGTPLPAEQGFVTDFQSLQSSGR